jgi:hypothetical protein
MNEYDVAEQRSMLATGLVASPSGSSGRVLEVVSAAKVKPREVVPGRGSAPLSGPELSVLAGRVLL